MTRPTVPKRSMDQTQRPVIPRVPVYAGILAGILILVLVLSAGCTNPSTGKTPAPTATPVPTVTHVPAATATATHATVAVQNTTQAPAPAVTVSTFLLTPGSQLRSDDLFRMYLSGVMANQSGRLAYRHVHTEQLTNVSPENPRASQTTDSTYTCEQALTSTNGPGTYSGKAAMHYVETANTSGSEVFSACTEYEWDIYYDKNTSLILGGVGSGNGGADQLIVPTGKPLANLDGLYTPDNYGNLEPDLLMGSSSYYLRGDEKITFKGNETVTVPAGTFTGAAHFTRQDENCYATPCTTTTRQYWAVPGIPGFVKIQCDMDGPDMYPRIHFHVSDETELTGRG